MRAKITVETDKETATYELDDFDLVFKRDVVTELRDDGCNYVVWAGDVVEIEMHGVLVKPLNEAVT